MANTILYESDVLEDLDLSVRDDSDRWPEFALKHVRVFSQITGQMVSLFTCHNDSFLCVEGLLDVGHNHTHLRRLS